MKLYKIITSLILIISFTVISCGAVAPEIVPNKAVLSDTYENITISGQYSGDGDVLIKIFMPGKDITDSASDNLLLLADQIEVTDGSFSKTYTLPELDEGLYKIYYNDSTTLNDFFWYIRDTTKEAWVSTLAGSTDLKSDLYTPSLIEEISEIRSYAEVLNIGIPQTEDGKTYVAGFIKKSLDNTPDVKEFTSAANLGFVVDKIKTQDTSDILDSSNKFSVSLWHEEDAPGEKTVIVSVEDIYKNSLSDAGRAVVLSSMKDKTITNATEFGTVFAQETLVASIKNGITQGYGHIDGILTDMNEIIPLNIPEYFALNSDKRANVVSMIPGANITSFATLISTLKSYAIDEGKTSDITIETNPGQKPSVTPSFPVSGGSGGGGGASVTPVTPTPEEPTPSNNSDKFNDIQNHSWAKSAIETLYDKGIVNGMGDGSFAPDRIVTREEFLTMLIRAAGIELNDKESTFADVSNDAWYRTYVMTAADKGILTGYDNGTAGVGGSITREDCCVFICRALGYDVKETENDFIDGNTISGYAQDSVNAVWSKGIIKGDENKNFNPQGFCTRAQAAVMINGILNQE